MSSSHSPFLLFNFFFLAFFLSLFIFNFLRFLDFFISYISLSFFITTFITSIITFSLSFTLFFHFTHSFHSLHCYQTSIRACEVKIFRDLRLLVRMRTVEEHQTGDVMYCTYCGYRTDSTFIFLFCVASC